MIYSKQMATTNLLAHDFIYLEYGGVKHFHGANSPINCGSGVTVSNENY